MKKLIIMLLITYDIYTAVNSLELLKVNTINILGVSNTIEQLNNSIDKLISINKETRSIVCDNGLYIISCYLQHKFKDDIEPDFSERFINDAINKGDLYYKYLEPLIFLSINLKLKALFNILNKNIDTNIDIYKAYKKYNITKHVRNRKLEKIKFLLKIGFVNFKDSDNYASLMIAIDINIDIVKLLINNGANINVHEKQFGFTPLIYTITLQKIDMLKLLLDNGADINIQDNIGSTALIIAVKSGFINMIMPLIANGANINIKDNNGNTALTYATIYKRKDILKLLIDNGADINVQDNNGVSALMHASAKNYLDIVKLLIDNKAEINFRSNEGNTALMLASELGNKKIVQLLIDNGAKQDSYCTIM